MKRTGYFFSVILLLSAATGLTLAQEEENKITLKGKIVGGRSLLNPVWNDAKDPKKHRYTFRTPSPTVGADYKQLTSFLPKELCIVVLAAKPQAAKEAFEMRLSGGRTTPVTLVVSEGATIKIVNDDPFVHRIHTVDEKAGLTANDLESMKSRQWTPPGPGKYELRDKVTPSVRSWIVVEPKALAVACPKEGRCACTHPNLKDEFTLLGLTEGEYKLRGYHNGEPVGKELPFEVRANPSEQEIRDPLVVGKVEEKKDKDKDKDKNKKDKED